MVKAGATVNYAIVAENAVIDQGATVGSAPPSGDLGDWGITVVAQDIEVGDGAVVPANAMITRNLKEVLRNDEQAARHHFCIPLQR